MSTTVEHERTANALLLFYEKVQPKGCVRPEGGAATAAAAAAAADHERDGDHEMEDSSAVKAGDENAAAPVPPSLDCGNAGGQAENGDGGGLPPPPNNMSPATTESDAEGGAGGDKKPPSGGVAGGAGPGPGAGKVLMLDGVEAYAEEVWEANVQYMLNSYVFDTEFHHFLRRVLW